MGKVRLKSRSSEREELVLGEAAIATEVPPVESVKSVT